MTLYPIQMRLIFGVVINTIVAAFERADAPPTCSCARWYPTREMWPFGNNSVGLL